MNWSVSTQLRVPARAAAACGASILFIALHGCAVDFNAQIENYRRSLISFDFRLVPDQSPPAVRAAVERFLRSRGWTIVTDEPDLATRLRATRLVRLQWDAGYPAFRADLSAPTSKAVIAAASKAASAPVVVMPMMGASAPLYELADALQLPGIGLPIVNHDNNQHAANENLRLQNLWDGIDIYAAMLAELNW